MKEINIRFMPKSDPASVINKLTRRAAVHDGVLYEVSMQSSLQTEVSLKDCLRAWNY